LVSHQLETALGQTSGHLIWTEHGRQKIVKMNLQTISSARMKKKKENVIIILYVDSPAQMFSFSFYNVFNACRKNKYGKDMQTF
jgi:hypothetical protein